MSFILEKIAVFGGSFNPVHKGHINFCIECDKFYDFSKIMLIPTNYPPHKNKNILASNKHRYNMLVEAIKSLKEDNNDNDEMLKLLDKFVVNDIELTADITSYSVITLKKLKLQYPDKEFYFLMGTDMFLTLKKWYKYEELLDYTNVVVTQREKNQLKLILDYKESLMEYGEKIDIIKINTLEMSSTLIRDIIKGGKQNLTDYLEHYVINYIKENRLYE